MRCPDASFAAFVRVFDQDSVGHTARLLYFTGRWRSGAAVDQGIALKSLQVIDLLSKAHQTICYTYGNGLAT